MPVLRTLAARLAGNRLASGGVMIAAAACCIATGASQIAAGASSVALADVMQPPAALAAPATAGASAPVVPVSAPSASPYWTVRPGDTLSSISAARCGTAADWSGIFYANKPPLTGPDSIQPGEVLRVRCTDPGYTYPKTVHPHVQATVQAPVPSSPSSTGGSPVAGGVLSSAQVGQLWIGAGGPAYAEGQAEEIAYCESGDNPDAYNPSGATGLFQILGAVVPGNLDDPEVNAENAVAKYMAAGDSFSPWVCQ